MTDAKDRAMRPHVNADGEFQSDKYPTCPPGKVPLSVKDKTAQDLLWTYAQRRRAVDAEFADDLEAALRAKGYTPSPADEAVIGELQALEDRLRKLSAIVDTLEAMPRAEPMSSTEKLAATVDTLGTYRRGILVGHTQTIEQVTNWMVSHGYPVGEDDSLNTLLFELERMAIERALSPPQGDGP